MEINDLLKIYKEDAFFQTAIQQLNEQQNIHLKGLSGSLDAILAVSNFQKNPQTNVFIFDDKDDAAYFYNDLQNLAGEELVFMFPMSYKRPYQYEEIDNANVLQRAEVLNKLNEEKNNLLIVTYP